MMGRESFVRVFTRVETTSVDTTSVCDTAWISEVLPAANGPVTRILNVWWIEGPAGPASCRSP